MDQHTWIYQLSAGGALIFFCYLLLRFVVGRLSESLSRLEQTLREIDADMANRDQIILNHLEHFMATINKIHESQRDQIEVIRRLCQEWGINNGRYGR